MTLPAICRNFEDRDVQIVIRSEEPWFVLADVCAVLGISLPADAAKRLDDDEKGMDSIHTLGGFQEMLIVSEPGLYKLLQTSRKPQAKRFDRWVRHEVLPQIRKTGSYAVPVSEDRLIMAVREIVAPLSGRFDGQDKEIEYMKRRQDAMAEDLSSIKFKVLNSRRDLKAKTKSDHEDSIGLLGGRCPCCGESEIIKDGTKSKFSQFDHFFSNSQPDIEHTWLICTPCHTQLSSGRVPRDQRDAEFKAYQNKRRRLPGRQQCLF